MIQTQDSTNKYVSMYVGEWTVWLWDSERRVTCSTLCNFLDLCQIFFCSHLHMFSHTQVLTPTSSHCLKFSHPHNFSPLQGSGHSSWHHRRNDTSREVSYDLIYWSKTIDSDKATIVPLPPIREMLLTVVVWIPLTGTSCREKTDWTLNLTLPDDSTGPPHWTTSQCPVGIKK